MVHNTLPQQAHDPRAPLEAMVRIYVHHEEHEEHEGSENETLQALLQLPNIEVDQKPLAYSGQFHLSQQLCLVYPL